MILRAGNVRGATLLRTLERVTCAKREILQGFLAVPSQPPPESTGSKALFIVALCEIFASNKKEPLRHINKKVLYFFCNTL